MAITPTTKPAQPGRKRISLPLLLDQLDREWDDLQAQDNPFTTHDDRALLAYYHAAVRIGLDWIQGDYHYPFPTWYQDQRLARLCTYLTGLEGQDARAVMDARDKQLTLLREPGGIEGTAPRFEGPAADADMDAHRPLSFVTVQASAASAPISVGKKPS